jgi:hypothetical protein
MKPGPGWLKLGYRLRRHRIGPLPLGVWPLLLGAILSALLVGTRAWPVALALGLIGLVLLGVMLNARRQGYVRFEQDESLAAHLPPEIPPVEADEKVPVRVTGWLEVRNEQRFFAEARADLATMETREHIVMARIPPSRMWLVAKSIKEVAGWWYAFVKPAHIRSIQTGWLRHGSNPRPALRIQYLRRRLIDDGARIKEVESNETIFISVDDRVTLHRLLENLVRDAGRAQEARLYVPL